LRKNVGIERDHLTLKVRPQKQKLAYDRVYLCVLSKGNFKGLLLRRTFQNLKTLGKVPRLA
jgi:hypothetical protein